MLLAHHRVTPDPWLRSIPERVKVFKMGNDLRVSGLRPAGTSSEPALTVNIASEGIYCVAHPAGDLDISTRNILFDACISNGTADMVIDMAQISFIDCGGYGGIIATSLVLHERGGSLTLRNPTGQPARLLNLLHPSDRSVDPSSNVPVPADIPIPESTNESQAGTSPHNNPQNPTGYHYRLSDGAGDSVTPGSPLSAGSDHTLLRPTEPNGPLGATRRVCTIRHPIDRC